MSTYAQQYGKPPIPLTFAIYRGWYILPGDDALPHFMNKLEVFVSRSKDNVVWEDPELVGYGDKDVGWFVLHTELDEFTFYTYFIQYEFIDYSRTVPSDPAEVGNAQLIVSSALNVDKLASKAYSTGLVTAGTFRGVIFETNAKDPMVRMDPTGFMATDASGHKAFYLTPNWNNTGLPSLQITGGSIDIGQSGVLETAEPGTNPRLWLQADGLHAIDPSGNPMFDLDITTDSLNIYNGSISGGTITGTTITGSVFLTAALGTWPIMIFDSAGILAYDAGENLTVALTNTATGLSFNGLPLPPASLNIAANTAGAVNSSQNAVNWFDPVHGGTVGTTYGEAVSGVAAQSINAIAKGGTNPALGTIAAISQMGAYNQGNLEAQLQVAYNVAFSGGNAAYVNVNIPGGQPVRTILDSTGISDYVQFGREWLGQDHPGGSPPSTGNPGGDAWAWGSGTNNGSGGSLPLLPNQIGKSAVGIGQCTFPGGRVFSKNCNIGAGWNWKYMVGLATAIWGQGNHMYVLACQPQGLDSGVSFIATAVNMAQASASGSGFAWNAVAPSSGSYVNFLYMVFEVTSNTAYGTGSD